MDQQTLLPSDCNEAGVTNSSLIDCNECVDDSFLFVCDEAVFFPGVTVLDLGLDFDFEIDGVFGLTLFMFMGFIYLQLVSCSSILDLSCCACRFANFIFIGYLSSGDESTLMMKHNASTL